MKGYLASFALAILYCTVAVAEVTPYCNIANVCFLSLLAEPSHLSFGFLLPWASTGFRNEFLGFIIVPNQYSWSGVYLNKDLKESLVIAGWFDDQNPMVSTRYVGDLGSTPKPYAGPVVTMFPKLTAKNGTHQTIVYRCRNCTTWVNGGHINDEGNPFDFGWTASQYPLDDASNSRTALSQWEIYGTGTIGTGYTTNYDEALQRLAGN